MNRIVLTVLILAIFAFAGYAQPKGPSVDERLNELKQELSLTKEQSDKIRPILEHEHKEMENVRELNKEDRRAVNEARENLREQTSRQILGILTDDQKASYQKLRAAKPQDPRLQELQRQLDLSPAQIQQLAPIVEKYQQEMHELRENSNGDRRKMREEMRSIRENEQKEIKEILSDEQKEKFDELNEERREKRGRRGGRPGGRNGGSRF